MVGATQIPTVTLDLTPIIVALITLVGAMAAGGVISSRAQRRQQAATADLARSQIPMSHAQYENVITEAAARLQTISETAIARLETELARAEARITELAAEVERVKHERDRSLAERDKREAVLKAELARMNERVIDLERRLETQGLQRRRHRDIPTEDPRQ